MVRSLPATELDLCSEQLWPSFDRPHYLVTDRASPTAGWNEIERHRAFGRRGKVDMILPLRRLAAARALTAYPGLRPLRRRLTRFALAAGIVTGLAGSSRIVALLTDGAASNDITVMQQLQLALTEDISAAMHVRRSANRKALLQVVDRRGDTLGFAKLARNTVSASGIRSEIDALIDMDGGSPTVRVPRVLLSGESKGFPFVFTEPLPPGIRGSSPSVADTPSISEFAAISPVHRWGSAGQTGHIARLHARLASLVTTSSPSPLLTTLGLLLEMVRSAEDTMPIAKWAHGDFAFWNTGRSRDGTLWCWDFENVEPDALAGLDVLHWHASRRRTGSGPTGVADREGILCDSAGHLTAFGIGSPSARALLYRTYVIDIAIRTLETAADDGWQHVWAQPDDVESLVRRACAPE